MVGIVYMHPAIVELCVNIMLQYVQVPWLKVLPICSHLPMTFYHDYGSTCLLYVRVDFC